MVWGVVALAAVALAETVTPVAVWDGDFSAAELGKYAGRMLLDENKTHGEGLSSVTIDQESQGMMFESDTAMGGITVIVRYSNLQANASAKRVLFTSCVNANHKIYRTGVRFGTDGKLNGIWKDAGTWKDGDYGKATDTVPPKDGVMAFVYSTDGTYLYAGAAAGQLSQVWGDSGLKSSNDNAIYGAGIGGFVAGSSLSGYEAAKGMTIHSVAVFDRVLTLDEMNNSVSMEQELAEECVLRISEIMPKPTDDQKPGDREGMDVNGLESGWVEVENTSGKWADFKDYRFIRVNRGKKTEPKGFGNFPSRLVAPHSRAIFYTSERYSNSKDGAKEPVSAFEHGTFNGKPMVMGNEYHNILVWGDKVNPKKSPFVRLYYAPGGDNDAGTVVDTVVVPSDLPEGWSIIVGDAAEEKGTRRWMCPTPTRGEENSSTKGLTRIGPNVGPLYEISTLKKTDVANEFAAPTPPAKPGEDYVVTLPINGVMNPDGTFKPRTADQIQSIKLVYRKDLDDSTLVTNDVDMLTKTTDKKAWGDRYTATIPAEFFPKAGHLIQWKVLITDGEGVEWTSPSFNNPDDGYEWYGTIVEAPALESATLPTWHMFATGDHLKQMDKDKDDQNLNLVTNYARVAIYDSSTSNYYDYVRIDLRGNTSAGFTKKSHGLRFAKAHPLQMMDVVTGKELEKEVRKTSLISEFADPSYMRQMIAFWLWRKMGNKVPFDFPVRCNLNGEFYQLAFNSERFTDELIEDIYGLDKFGYGYKNVGTLKSDSGTSAGKIEKKTPDDEDETNITVLEDELRAYLKQYGAQDAAEDTAALTKFVVERFDLPAWLNYLASARITQEMDDVWANVCAYYDNPTMKEGVRGTGTWMPLGYDFNLSFGQWYYDDIKGERFGLMSNQDWFKSHPFYGGNRVRCHTSSAMTATVNYGNDGFEAVLQSRKFRRLYLRRLRTLMDQELKAPGTAETDTPFMVKMREMADIMRSDAALDKTKWKNDGTDDAIDVWTTRPKDMDAGIDDIWENYVVPRRTHLYVTHSVTNDSRDIGYGSSLNAGIPEAQSPIDVLAPNIRIANLSEDGLFSDTDVVAIYNGNDEAVDMSGWSLALGAEFEFPAGTVCDAKDYIYIVADRRKYIEAHEAKLTDEVIVGNATMIGESDSIKLLDAGERPVCCNPTADMDEFYEWLKGHNQVSADQQAEAGASSAAARSVAQVLRESQVEGKAGTLYDEYVAGTNPEDPNSVFKAEISMVDGTPVVTWTPDLKQSRHYTIYGANSLGADVEWQVVPSEEEGGYKFFKVQVDMLP